MGSVGNTPAKGVVSMHFVNLTTWGSEQAVLAGTARMDRLLSSPEQWFDISGVVETHLIQTTLLVVQARLRRESWQAPLAPGSLSDKGTYTVSRARSIV